MSLVLSSADLENVTRAMRLLISPLDHASVDEWRSAVNHHLKDLLCADSAGFLLPVSEGLALYSEEHDPNELAAYPELAPPDMADGTPAWERMIRIGVDTAANAYGRHYEHYLASEYYHEYAGANRAHDPLFASMALWGFDASSMASLYFWHERPGGRRFGEREVALLRLLFPAFRAGVEAQVRWGRRREDLLHTLEGLERPTLLYDLAGRVLHVTPAAEAILEADPEAAVLRGDLLAVVDELRRSAPGAGPFEGGPPGNLAREVRTRTARYRLCGCLYGVAQGEAAVAVVALERLDPALPAAEEILERFGLTPRQAEVALLLAQRLSNTEIATRLFISPHTALRHTEAVKAKLGIGDRKLVAARLWEREVEAAD